MPLAAIQKFWVTVLLLLLAKGMVADVGEKVNHDGLSISGVISKLPDWV